MARKKRRRLPAGVKRLRDRVERWRRTRAKRTRMPAELWSEAMVQARREGAYLVARAARLNFDCLRRRLAEAAASEAAAELEAGAEPNGFVELSGAQILGPARPAGGELEMVDAAGNRLTVRLAAEVVVDLAQVGTRCMNPVSRRVRDRRIVAA
jgi:hypothetical protein